MSGVLSGSAAHFLCLDLAFTHDPGGGFGILRVGFNQLRDAFEILIEFRWCDRITIQPMKDRGREIRGGAVERANEYKL